MSKVVDHRVVEMQFDNAQFEKNVASTMSTLEQLKSKLSFSGSTKGLEDVGRAAKNISMDGLSAGIETVNAKFSAMQIVGATALARITNDAITAGKNLVKSLTIDPVTTGFNEYELKMDSVKTIMASTGESVEKVNEYLNELNEYSDQTIYSFSDMTQNIGKFTNAGVKLEDAVMAIKGISNEAAVSGANANEASRAMYNFAQALSAGYVKLIDWKSIENANMATVEFKQQLIDTAVAAGTLKKTTNGMYRTLKGKTLSATQNFNDALQDQWMTSEVLVSTLKDYADANTEIGKKAFAAAQDVTKLSQVFDILKETAQSGWARTWEIIFGDIEQAKSVFTPMTEFLSSIITGIDDFRNSVLEGAFSNPFEGLLERLGTITGGVEGLANATGRITRTTEEYEQVVNEVIRGEWGRMHKRWNALTEAGYDWAKVQNMVNERMGYSKRHVSDWNDSLEEASSVQAETIEQLLLMSDAQLRELGLTGQEIESLRELAVQAEKTGIPLESLLEDMTQLNGRTLMVKAFANAGNALRQVMEAIGNAWKSVFPPESVAKSIWNFIAALHKCSTYLGFSDTQIENLTRTFKGLFAIIDIITTLTGGAFKIAFKIIGALLTAFDTDILSVTAAIGDSIVYFRDWLDSILDFTDVFAALAPIVKRGAEAVVYWFNTIKSSEIVQDFFQGFMNGLKAGASAVWNAIIDFGTQLVDKFAASIGVQSPSWMAFDIALDFFRGFVNGALEGVKMVVGKLRDFGSAIIGCLSGIDVNAAKDVVKGLFSGVEDFLKNFQWKDLIAIIPLGITAVGVKKIFDLVSAFTHGIYGINGLVEGLWRIEKNFARVLRAYSVNLYADSIQKIAVSIAVLAFSIVALTYAKPEQLDKAVDVILTLAIVLGVMAIMLSVIGGATAKISKDGIQISGLRTSLVGIGIAVLLLGVTAKLLSGIDGDKLENAFWQLAKVVLAIAGLVAVFALVSLTGGAKHIKKLGSMMIKLGIALLLMAVVCKVISKLTPEEMATGVDAIMKFAILTGILAVIARVGGTAMGKLGAMMIAIGISMLMMVGLVKLIAYLEPEEMTKAALFALGFVSFVGGLVAATTICGKDKIAKVGGLLLAVSVSMLIMIGVCKLASTLTWEGLLKGLIAVGAFVLLITAFVAVSKLDSGQQMAKATLSIIALSIAVAMLSGIAVLLGMVPTDMLVKGVLAVAVLGAIMTAMIVATRGASKCTGNIMAMSFAILMMAGAIFLLSVLDTDDLVSSTIAIGLLMVMFAVVLKTAGTMGKVTATLIVITIAIGLIVGILYLLSQNDPAANIGAAVALSAVMLALALTLRIMSGMAGPAAKALVAILIMAIAVGAIGGVLYLLKNNDPTQAIGMALALSVFLVALIGALFLMKLVGAPSLLAIGALALVTLVVGALAAILYVLRDIDPQQALGVVIAISAFLAAMEIACVAAGIIGAVAGPAVVGLGILVTFIGALGLVVIGLLDLAMDVIAGMPKLGQDLTDFMTNVQGFLDGVNNIPDNISDKIGKLSAAILKLTGAEFLNNIADFFSGGNVIGELGAELKSFGDDIGSFTTNANKIDAAIESMGKIKDITNSIESIDLSGLTEFGSALKNRTSTVTTDIVNSITSRGELFKAAGVTLMLEFASGIKLGNATVTKIVEAVVTQTSVSVRSKYDAFRSAGSYLVDGLAAGISANTYKAEAKARAMASAAAKAASDELEIHSPSKVFTKMGSYVPEGFAAGIDNMRKVVVNSAVDMANAPLDSVREAISGISDAISSDVDAQPTIRPVLDLSNIRNGASSIGGLFGSPIGTLNAVGSINAMMSRSNQNGADNEVVSAINGLSKKLDDVGNTTYSINGITYDDGSAIADAVKTIVRAAKIERRV